MMHILFNPNDWLGRHQALCLALVLVGIIVGGSL